MTNLIKNSKKVGTINYEGSIIDVYSTFFYEGFKKMKGNRDVNAGHVRRIKASMMEQLLFTIVLINEFDEVIDGQHRINALIENEEKIYFAVLHDYTIKEIQRYNINSKEWGISQFAKCYAEKGKKDYQAFLDFKEKYKFSNSSVIQLLSDRLGGGWTFNKEEFQDGKFKIIDIEKAERIANMVCDFEFYKHYNSYNFIWACYYIFQVKGYNHARMKYAFEARAGELNGQVKSVSDYKQELQRIYNTGLSKEKKLRFYDPIELDTVK